MEQTCNLDAKTSGGLTGITLDPNAVNRWTLSESDRSAVLRACEVLSGLSDHHRARKDLDSTRKVRDERDVNNIIRCLEEMINPFE